MSKYLLIPILFFLLSCKDNNVIEKNNFKNQITFPPSNVIEEEAVKISEIIDTTIIVKLETNKECLIGSPKKIKIYNNHIFVLDDKTGLLEFDMKGGFIQKIGRIGNGPTEYRSPKSFDIDELKKKILIYDRSTLKLLKYNLKGGFEEALKVKIYSSNFAVDKYTGDYIFDTYLESQVNSQDEKQYSIIKTDKKGNISSRFQETNEDQNALKLGSTYNLFNNSAVILYNSPFKNEIYQIEGNKIVPFLSFGFKGKAIPDKLDYNIDIRDFVKEIEEKKYEYFDNRFGYFLINNSLLFTVYRDGYYENYIYNLETKKLNLVLKPEVPNVGFIMGQPACVYNNAMVSYAQTEWFTGEDYSSDIYKNSKFLEIVKQMKNGDNPIIIFDRIKI